MILEGSWEDRAAGSLLVSFSSSEQQMYYIRWCAKRHGSCMSSMQAAYLPPWFPGGLTSCQHPACCSSV
jgi:hypothetical protein